MLEKGKRTKEGRKKVSTPLKINSLSLSRFIIINGEKKLWRRQ
jgi:hypothetical protein